MRGTAAIYVRISADASGQGLGVARQEADARELCARRGWIVAEVFCDNDRSAFSRRSSRARYQAMLGAIRDGRIDTVVAWHPDRLHRQTRELVPFIDLVNAQGVQVETVTAGKYDLTSASGRLNARILGDVAEFESEHKAERVRRKLEQNAAEGKHHGGSRPYGWADDRVTLVDAEAEMVRQAATSLLAGESVKSIARAMNDAGQTTSTGRPWRDVNVRDMLLRERNAGLRVHHGAVVGRGLWAPIMGEAEFLQVKALLSDPTRRTTPGRDGRVHLLTGLARCGLCNGPVVVAKGKPYKGVAKSIYRCRQGHVSRDQVAVDDLVSRVVLARLALPDARELLAAPGEADGAAAAMAEAQVLQARLAEAAEAFAAGVLTLGQLTTINATVRPKLAEAEGRAASPDRSKVLGSLAGAPDPAEVWESLSPERRRAVVALLVNVTILPTSAGRTFRPDHVGIEWLQA